MEVTKTYCDICGKEVSLSAPIKIIKHTRKAVYSEILDNDCCERCLIKIMRFIDDLKKENENANTKSNT